MDNRKFTILMTVLLSAFVLILNYEHAPIAYAQGETFGKWVIANGGGVSSGGNITIKDTIGEPIIGPSTGTATGLYAGFWYEVYHPTSVTLASFNAASQSNAIVLRWTTLTEVNLSGFNIYRALSPLGTQTKLNANLIPSQTFGGMLGANYMYSDANIIAGARYYYWLQEVSTTGGSKGYGPIATGGIFLPFVIR